MDNRRYDYSPIIRRPKIEWPNHGRIALWVAPNIEFSVAAAANAAGPALSKDLDQVVGKLVQRYAG